MLDSLAPKPWRPPTVRNTESSKFDPVNSEPSTTSGRNVPSGDPSCLWIGMPRPVLVTLSRPPSTSMATSMRS
eukprot:5291680-Prymnesium_polylepis.1